MKLEKYFNLMEYGVERDICEHMIDGWKIVYKGTTLVIMEKEFKEDPQ